MRIKEIILESFDQPYPLTWSRGDHGDNDAFARLPDGSPLSISFEYSTPYEVLVSFTRDHSIDVTGAGDAQRVFATVLFAIQQFVKKEQPYNINFSATKEVEPGQNPESRAKLYKKLVDRYATNLGYGVRAHDQGDQVEFDLYRNQDVAEDIPQPGPSSGAPKQFGSDAKIQTRQMTAKQLIDSVPGLPYYNNVVDDWDAKDYSWGVTKKVIEYAAYLKDHPESLSKLPPILVLNSKFEDGAHRVSAIWLLQQRMDPKNPLWKNAKLNVQFVKQGVAEGVVSDLDQDRQDVNFDSIVGYVISGLKKHQDIGRMELDLYKWGGKELVDVDQELQDRGFRDLADLADHIKQHDGKYVPPTDFGLGDLGRGVAEGSNNITYQQQKGKNKFSVEMLVNGKSAGVFQYDADTGRTITELDPEFRGQGLGQRLILKGIYTAAMLGMDYVEDESRTEMFDRTLDSLADAGYIVNDDDRWYVTGSGEQFLKQAVAENFADGKRKGKSRPGRVARAGASCQGSVTDLRARAKRAGGERGRMYHWCANMKAGRKK
jgi:GNAT superfamily N-acetyltransferase